ncbi:MAG: hypothetical protein MJA29_07420 [Candidatus Omnitrophica bacterium]|nr:hypothetical protein [Candidatus Omnitrophota bacterium]
MQSKPMGMRRSSRHAQNDARWIGIVGKLAACFPCTMFEAAGEKGRAN